MQLQSNPGFRQNQDSHSGLVDSEMKAFWYLLCHICIFDISFFKIKKKKIRQTPQQHLSILIVNKYV